MLKDFPDFATFKFNVEDLISKPFSVYSLCQKLLEYSFNKALYMTKEFLVYNEE